MKKRISILGVLVVMLTCSCVKTDYTAKTWHPLQGLVRLSLNWSSVQDSLVPPNEQMWTALKSSQGNLGNGAIPPIAPDSYHFFAYNHTSTVDVYPLSQGIGDLREDMIASVKKVNDSCVLASCDRFFNGLLLLTVEADKNYEVSIPMKQVSRDISFELRVIEGDPSRISSIEAELGGIAGAWNLLEDLPYGPIVKVKPVFERNGDLLVSGLRLLGVNGSVQKLILTLHFTDGRSQIIQSDLSSQLSDFNQHKSLPMVLSGSVLTPIQSGVSASITNWTVETGNATAN